MTLVKRKETGKPYVSDPFPLSIPVVLIGSLLMSLMESEGKNHQKAELSSASGQAEPEQHMGARTIQLEFVIESSFSSPSLLDFKCLVALGKCFQVQ